MTQLFGLWITTLIVTASRVDIALSSLFEPFRVHGVIGSSEFSIAASVWLFPYRPDLAKNFSEFTISGVTEIRSSTLLQSLA